MLPTLSPILPLRAVAAAATAALALGALAGTLPLLEVPGYELGEAGALLAALLVAPWLGIGAARRERARAGFSPLRALFASSLGTVAILAGLFAGSALRAAFGPCRPLFAAAFFPVLALPSALLGAALAVAAGLAARGRRALAGALYAGAVVLLLAVRLDQLYRGPAAFLLDPLLGYFPGPLYDEVIPLDARLWVERVGVLGWAALIAGLTGLAVAARRKSEPCLFRTPALFAALGLCTAGVTHLAQARLQGAPDLRTAIVRELGGRREGPRCIVYLPGEKPAGAAEEILRECEFHAADVAAILGVDHPPRVTVFVYRNPEEKRRLVGAARTDYTKPWLPEIHVNDEPLPHPVLRHEMVHAIASALAPGPLHLPARAWVLPQLSLVEGLAVALESPRSGFTVHEWSKAARDLGLLPDVVRLLGPAGFWSQAPARAYTAAGSFLAYLLRRYGAAPVREAYRTGDLATAFGRPLPELAAEWQRSLDAVSVPPELAQAAALWFGRGSIFERRCARESAALLRQAAAAAAAGRSAEACRLYARDAEVGVAPDALLMEGRVLSASGDLHAALDAFRAAGARIPAEDRARRSLLLSAEGDLSWRRGDLAGAVRGWEEAARFPLERAEARLLEVKLRAVADPMISPAARAYLLDPADPDGLVRVARSADPLAAYLVGRALLARGDRASAAPELARAAGSGLPPLVLLEARLSLIEARCQQGDAPLLAPLASAGEADRARLAEARRRCDFDRVEAGGREGR
ncbi:MAG TPA: type VI secretion system protein [Anaeromyxobacter sp.]|nr:type VI secretion system protein [Anaeromyxobacter sp.]